MRAALLYGIPIQLDDFVNCINVSDWLSRFDPVDAASSDQRARLLQDRWESEYFPLVAEPLLKLAEEARDLNVAVQERATLDDLFRSTSACDCVILFGHWKGHEILATDIPVGVDSRMLLARSGLDESELGSWLNKQLSILVQAEDSMVPCRRAWWRIWHRSRQLQFQSIVEIFTEAIENPNVAKASEHRNGVNRVLESRLSGRTRRREQLDRLFGEYLCPGNRLELYDGLHAKEEIEAAVADHFLGILDLTTCTSTVLADFISAKRNRTVRTVQFESLQEFAWHCQCVGLALRMSVEQGIAYQEARALALQIIRAAVAEEAKTKDRDTVGGRPR